MKLIPLVIWFIQAAIVVGVVAIATMLIHNPGIEVVVWIVAGVLVGGCLVLAALIARGGDNW